MTSIPTWLACEPVRTYLYGVAGVALLLLNGYGLLADEKVALWGNLLAVILVPAVEKARTRVRPVFPRNDERGQVDVVSVLAIVVLVLAILWLLGVLPR